MAHAVGDRVMDPRPRPGHGWGMVIEVRRNPACHLRGLVISWDDGAVEELTEDHFGPIDD